MPSETEWLPIRFSAGQGLTVRCRVTTERRIGRRRGVNRTRLPVGVTHRTRNPGDFVGIVSPSIRRRAAVTPLTLSGATGNGSTFYPVSLDGYKGHLPAKCSREQGRQSLAENLYALRRTREGDRPTPTPASAGDVSVCWNGRNTAIQLVAQTTYAYHFIAQTSSDHRAGLAGLPRTPVAQAARCQSRQRLASSTAAGASSQPILRAPSTATSAWC